MKILPLLVSASLGGLSAIAHAEDYFSPPNPARVGEERALYGYFQGFSANDTVPVGKDKKDAAADYRPRSGKNVVLESINYEVGVQWQSYRIGYIERSDWIGTGNRDFADFVHANLRNAPFDTGRTYALDYRGQGFSAEGAKLTKSFSNDMAAGWKFGWGGAVSLLRGHKYGRDDVFGTAFATGNSGGRAFDANFTWKGGNSNANLLSEGFGTSFPSGDKPSGHGYAVDLGISIAREDGLRFEWVANDAYGRINWNDIPEQTLTVVANDTSGGSIVIRPTLVSLTETLPVKHSLSLFVPTRIADVELSDTIYEGINMPRVGLSKRLNADWSARADYDVRFATVGLGVTYRWLYLNLRTDSLDLNKAHAYGGSIGARLDF